MKITCGVCGNPEPKDTADHHHIRPKAFGGADSADNMIWLCAACHARLHRIQAKITHNKKPQAYRLTAEIFHTDGKARSTLWMLAITASDAENEVKKSFGSHRDQVKVSLTLDTSLWEAVKLRAKRAGVTTAMAVTDALRKAGYVDDSSRHLQEDPPADHTSPPRSRPSGKSS